MRARCGCWIGRQCGRSRCARNLRGRFSSRETIDRLFAYQRVNAGFGIKGQQVLCETVAIRGHSRCMCSSRNFRVRSSASAVAFGS